MKRKLSTKRIKKSRSNKMQSKKNIRTNRKSKSIKRNNSRRRKKLKGGAGAKRCGRRGFCIDNDKWTVEKCYLGFMDTATSERECGPNEVCCFPNKIN